VKSEEGPEVGLVSNGPNEYATVILFCMKIFYHPGKKKKVTMTRWYPNTIINTEFGQYRNTVAWAMYINIQ
jgi:hypothetical protein